MGTEPLRPVQPPEPPSPRDSGDLFVRPVAERRRAIHDTLHRNGKQHDAYLRLADIADPSSVEVLMLRLCTDYPDPEGPPPAGFQWGYECSQVHLTDVLRNVTNHDAGMSCSEWRRWVDRNRRKTWNQWIAEGFAQDGVALSLPLGTETFHTLLRYLSDRREWRQENAWRVLSWLPPHELERRLAALSDSRDSVTRQGVERARSNLRREH